MRANTRELAPTYGESAFWHNHLLTGVLMYLASTMIGAAYLHETPDGPNRKVLWGLLTISAATVAVILVIPRDKIVQSAQRLAYFVSWSLFTLPFAGFVAWLDGGLTSPMALLLIMPMLYAALAYPVKWVAVVAVSGLVVASAIAMSTAASPSVALVYLGSLGIIGSATTFTAAQRELQDARLMTMATHDSLTGCLDHHTFYQRLERQLALPDRPELAVVVFDIDQFKQVNDNYGHVIGDDILRNVGSILRQVTRAGDLVGRIGGDEFAACFIDARYSVAETAANRVNGELAQVDLPVRVSVSVGLAAIDRGQAITAQNAITLADEAMYRHKEARSKIRSISREAVPS